MALLGTGFGLCVKDISSLRPHERTIQENVARVAEELKRDKVQKDPMIVDGETDTVLDGMHRVAAFKALGVRRAVCCAVDYKSEGVSLKRWARIYGTTGQTADLGALEALGFSDRVSPARALELLESKNSDAAVFVGRTALVPAEQEGLAGAFGIVDRVDKLASESGWKRGFVPEEEVVGAERPANTVLLLTQRLLKDEVVAAGVTGELFPCKTSMHTIDPRPVAVRFPIDRLDTSDDDDLASLMGGRRGQMLPGGSVYEGRRYKERLLRMDRE